MIAFAPSADRITTILEKLVAFPTISASSNHDVNAYLAQEASAFGAKARYFANKAGDKANLLLTIGPEAPGGVLYSGHTDIVPVEGQNWTGDPWTLRKIGSRLVARGATDMKGFIACCMAALPEIAAKPLSRPIHLAFSYDEEVGCSGVGDMAKWIGESGLRPRLAVIGEATSMDLVSAHKGGLIGWTTVTGKPGHSSQPDRYVNAIMAAAEMIECINRIRRDMRAGPQFAGLDPPYSTIQVNQISGGLHGNIVAETCRFFWEMRIIPGQSDMAVLERMKSFAAERIEPAMKAVDPQTGISIDVMARIPGLQPNGDADLEQELLRLLGRSSARAVPYGTEAGIFQACGCPAVVIGPGDIKDAHQPDESIEMEQLVECTTFLSRLAETCR